MKYIFTLLVLLIIQSSAVLGEEEFQDLNEFKGLLKEGKHEEAAKYIANKNNKDILFGYRTVAWFLSRQNHGGKNSQAIKEYYEKGCEGQTDIACIEYGLMLEHYKQFKKAEEVYLRIDNVHKEISSAERLYYLYHNKTWDGHSTAKFDEWRDIYFKRIKEHSNDKQNRMESQDSKNQ